MNAPKKQNPVAPLKAGEKPRAFKAPRKQGKPKKVASPIATGGRGFSFENRVQAIHLIAMCLGGQAHGIPPGNTVTKLIFQARIYGHNTDDLVVDFVNRDGAPGTLRLQLKRSLTARKSDETFREAVGLAWLDFRDASFRRGRDVLMIAFLPTSLTAMSEAAELTRQAVGTSQAEDWKIKVFAEGFSNQKRREAYSALEAAAAYYNNGENVELSDLHQFAIHLKFQQFDLDSDFTAEVTSQQQLLSFAVAHGSPAEHWLRFVTCCSELNDVGGDVDLQSVGRHIGNELDAELHLSRTVRNSRKAEIIVAQQRSTQLDLAPLGSSVVGALASGAALGAFAETAPPARSSSLNKMVSRLLDDVSDLQKKMRYHDAIERLTAVGQEFENFDAYQKALWHLLRGMCRWHLSDDHESAAKDFLRAAELNDEGPKFAAARIRGHLMLEQVEEALEAGIKASARFPAACEVWVAYSNARIVNGTLLGERDIPPEFQEQAIAWHVAAASQERVGNFIVAFELAKIGASKPDSTFFNREGMLRYALEDATKNKVNVGLRMLPPDQAARLRTAVNAFLPRHELLWSADESPRALKAAVVNLGYAYLLIAEPKKALELVAESRSRGVDLADADVRIELEAHRDLGTSDVALRETAGYLSSMSSETLLTFAQTALDLLDEKQLLVAEAEALRRSANTEDGARLVELLRNMRWELWLRTERTELVNAEVQAAGIDGESSSIVNLMFAIRAAKKAQSSKWIDRIVELASVTEEPGELHIAAQLLYRSNRYEESAAIYTRILPPHTCSQLHGELLDCYMRLGYLAKAKALLDVLPVAWEQDSAIRGMALNLTQLTRDWSKVDALAKVELSQYPNKCTSWLLSISASVQCASGDVEQLIAGAPLALDGTPQEESRLASIELQRGQPIKGLLRLYAMRRRRLGDTETAALHLISVLATGTNLDAIDHIPEVVGPGTCVVVRVEDGSTCHWTIDPVGVDNLAPTEEFISESSLEAKQLLGKKVGDEIILNGPFGGSKCLRVTHLISAHRRLINLAHVAIRTQLAPTEYLSSMEMKKDEEGNFDFATIRQQLERRSQYANQSLDLYRQHPAPLGMLAKHLGIDTLELVRGWPHDGPKLEMVKDGRASVVEARKLLDMEERWVLDLSMLTELVTLGHQNLLAFLPSVYVAAAVRDIICSKLESTAVFRKSGTVFAHDGELGFRENTVSDWQRDRDFLQLMLNCIDTHCTLRPAYGPIDIEANVVRMRRILSDDEYGTLLLSLELKASVLSLDGRFRRICAIFGRGGAWPQPFFEEMFVKNRLSIEDHSLAVLKLLFSRRTFVSIDQFDLLRLMAMEDSFILYGMHSLRDYFAESTMFFPSGERVFFSFLASLRYGGICSFELILSLLEHLAEGLFRHPGKPEGWFAGAVFQAWAFLGLRSDDSREKAVHALTEAEARAGCAPKAFTLDLTGLRREMLSCEGRTLASQINIDGISTSREAEIGIPSKKQDALGTTGVDQDLDSPEVL
ncbi:PIN domain-containing protein [Comamonas terrigena]|uniref:PIN domain-containing protein n=1 Tax=Comamonas terrigena TaxID=32013 RepID=UPI00244C6F89|nr:hypothetical protein [Comamonas terrigena]MDH1703548.1 hypothetical protein [Comamonas terrigena]